jgi:hypothetical protein
MGLFNPFVLYSRLSDDLTVLTNEECDTPAEVLGRPGISYKKFASAALLNALLKKCVTEVAADADEKALKKFEAINSDCANWMLDPNRSLVDDVLIGEIRQIIHRFWWVESNRALVEHPSDVLDMGRTGPGASVLAVGSDFYSKMFGGPLSMTCTHHYEFYRRYISTSPRWVSAEAARSAMCGPPSVVKGNRLGYVAKDNKISRIICTEPGLNMFYQLGLGEIISARLKRFFGIDLSSQPDVNREMARVGSLDESDGMVTIDLSSASDSMSLRMLDNILPASFMKWVCRYRSPITTLPCGREVTLEMASTMGNGYTFPLQTMLFSACVSAAYAIHGSPYPPKAGVGLWSVFGDDIVCRKAVARTVIRGLNLLGFKVNADKSFLEGRFRESCGSDFLDGLPVRGVYIKGVRSEDVPYKAFNRLNSWSSMTGIL